ncbi:hypothetical protein ONZ45_g13204 [Pleurotus djamor]|nr:hypothetical protein ONZ45_g13204 [Pleurotus djamor]
MADSLTVSVSRVQRLLRPLRSTLASSSSSSQTTVFNENAPLQLIPPPAKAAALCTMSKEDRLKVVELSRKFYNIRDCFRNVVAGALGRPDHVSSEVYAVPSLASICAKRMGECINQHIGQLRADADAEGKEIEESNLLEAAEELLDAIPSHHRRWAMIGHALDEVLASAPGHSTLITLLLEVCLSHKLPVESAILLRMLLVTVCHPLSASDPAPMMAHPSHSTYLGDLLATWTEASFAPSQFIDILTECFSDPRHSRVWSSKAVIRLSGFLRSQSSTFHLFLRLVHGCMTCLHNSTVVTANEHELAENEDAPLMSELLIGQLTAWLVSATDHILRGHSDTDSSQLDAFEILQLAHFEGFRPIIGSTRLSGPFLSFATVCLDLDTCAGASAALMEGVDPRTQTYDSLVISLFNILSNPSYDVSDLRAFLSSLEKYAGLLQSAQYPRLEASLWACALRHFDPIRSARDPDTVHEAAQIRMKLIANVEASERRCFAPTPSKPRRFDPTIQSPNSGLKFVWESSLDCWLRRQTPQVPRVKRRKVEESPLKRALTRSIRHNRHISMQANASCPPRFSLSSGPPDTSNRRVSFPCALPEFASLLSNALSCRTSLREKENPQNSYVHPPPISQCNSTKGVPRMRLYSPPSSPVHAPSSDDALDLFSYR